MFSIKRFTPDNYSDFAKLWNYAYPEGEKSALELRMLDQRRDPKLISKRWVAESEGKIVGVGVYEHWNEFYHPRKYLLHVIVDPEYQRMGAGSTLYTQVMNDVKSRNPLTMRAWVLEGNSDGIHFLEKRGFEREMRAGQSTRDVQTFDFSPYTGHEDTLKERGIEIKLFSELGEDNKRVSKFHKIYCASVKNMDLPDKPTLPALSDFNKAFELNPTVFDEHVIALQSGEFIGICTLVPVKLGFYNEVFGVSPEYQNQGIAKGLLLKGIDQARIKSKSSITIYIRDRNTTMLNLVSKLGFVQERGRMLYQKKLREE